MRLRFVLFFLLLLGGLACKALAVKAPALDEPKAVSSGLPKREGGASVSRSPGASSEKEVHRSRLVRLASKLHLVKEDSAPPSDEYRLYFSYLKRVQGSLQQKGLKLDSIALLPPMAALQKGEGQFDACDCSRCFFDCFRDSFRDVKELLDSLQGDPEPYLRPLLDLARALYSAAREAAGATCCPFPVERRGVSSDTLKRQIREWDRFYSGLDFSELSPEGRRVVKGVVRVVRRCVDCAERLNNQRTRREMTMEDIQFMERILASLVKADKELGTRAEGR